LVGCGRISASHLDAIQACPQFGRLVAVVDSDRVRACEVARRYGARFAFDNLESLFEIDDVEAVYLCTPNALHEAQGLRVLASGRHALVEKPMAESAAGAARMAEAAAISGLTLAAGHTFRHGDTVRYIQDHRGDFGELRAVQISTCVHWDGPQASWWRDRTPAQGLILSLLAPHALDFLQCVMGAQDPIRLTVEAARHQSAWRAEDEAMILLRYPHECMAFIHLSYNQRFVLDRKTLHFEKAMLRIEDGDYLWVDDRLVVQPSGPPNAGRHRMGGRDLGHYFRSQFVEFARAVRGKTHRSVLHHDAERLAQLTERVLQAAIASGHVA
jgi:predicted dehydrogenase